MDENLSSLIGEKIQTRNLKYDLKPELFNQDDVRPILIVTLWNPHLADLNYLYWNNGQNLDELDRKVIQNKFTEDDFAYSVITRYQQTRCFECNWAGHTLVIDDWHYFRTPGLSTLKIRQNKILQCPNCQNSLRQLVVKIF